MVTAYFQTWSAAWTSDPSKVFNLPIGIDMVILAFVTPTCNYTPGSFSFSGTGLDFSMDFKVVQQAIQLVQSQGIKVLLAVGGATYPFPEWTDSIAKNIVALCSDLNCDGIDIDWEPVGGASVDTQFPKIIQGFRTYLPKPKLLTAAVWSTGAYGKNGSTYQGMNILGLTQAGSDLDQLHLMAYDAGPTYDPLGAYEAYRIYYKGRILLGIEPGPQSWGGYLITKDDILKMRGMADGFFIWSLQKASTGTPSVTEIISLLTDGATSNPSTSNNLPNIPIAVSSGTQTTSPLTQQFTCPHCNTVLKVIE